MVLKAIRADEEIRHTSILICSNMNSMDETGGSIALGADGYIVKSDENLKAIPETIENILSK